VYKSRKLKAGMHSAAVYNSTWRLENNVKKAWNKLHNDIA